MGGKSVGASTKRGSQNLYLSSLTICTDFYIIILKLLGWGKPETLPVYCDVRYLL